MPRLVPRGWLFLAAAALATAFAACARETATAPARNFGTRLATVDPGSSFPDYGAVKVCNYYSTAGVPGAGTYQVIVDGVALPSFTLTDNGQCVVVWQTSGDGSVTIKVTQTGPNCTLNLAVRHLVDNGNPDIVFEGATNTYTATVNTANGLSSDGYSLWFQNDGSGGCQPPPEVCTDQNATNYGGPLPCVYPNPPCPEGSFTFNFLANGDLFIKYDQFPAPNDNSYGINAVGWPNGHKFSDLVGSDHAGFQLVDGNGTVRLSFNVDYLSANTSAPSGYASLGVTGGDGKMLVGTADGISATTSLANNLNNINIPGLFNASHVQQFGSVNVLINSPPTDAAHTTYVISDPALAGWDFHDTYFVTISAAKLASLGFNAATWQVVPNPDQLHNSPAKACPSTGETLSITKYEVKDKQVKITILNSGSTDVILNALTLTWPSATNGSLTQVKLDADVVYNGPAIADGSANLTTAQLVTDQNKRKLNHGSSDVYTLVFGNNADPNLSHYTGSVTFGSTTLTVLPH